MKKILKVILSVFCLIIIFFNLIIIFESIISPSNVPTILGVRPYIVESGSSQTDVEYGELVLVKAVKEVNVGDIVAVKTSDKKATTYSVKNVNNDMLKLEDETKDYTNLSKNSIQGKVVYKSKFWGNCIMLLQNPIVIIFILVLTTLLGIVIYKLLG